MNHLKKLLRTHFPKVGYLDLFSSLSGLGILLCILACNTSKKVPDGQFLLTKNRFLFKERPVDADELENYVAQKPNKKQLFILPIRLGIYNLSNPKYDSLLNDYKSYPREQRTQKLRDSLFSQYNMPEMKGKSLYWDRLFHNLGEPPVIWSEAKTISSKNLIENRLVYRGYWHAEVDYKKKLDSAAKKAEITYIIDPKEETKISQYSSDIKDPNVQSIFSNLKRDPLLFAGQRLDQTLLERESKRISEAMRENSYYQFNSSGEELYFIADSLKSKFQVPIKLVIKKDSAGTGTSYFKKASIGKIEVGIVENIPDFKKETTETEFRGIIFHKIDSQYRDKALWQSIILKPEELYQQKNLDLTRRNIIAMNNFTILKAEDKLRKGSDSIVDVQYLLKPLPKYDLRVSADANYSQLLNFGIAPSVDLVTRNLFGGAENMTSSLSGAFGTTQIGDDKTKFFNAFEISFQNTLKIPRLLLPIPFINKLIPKTYSPTTAFNLGTSIQNNIGLGRISFNGGLQYTANVNDVVSHQLNLLGTQLSFTRNKERYYEFFPGAELLRNNFATIYLNMHPEINQLYSSGAITKDGLSEIISRDTSLPGVLNPADVNAFNEFRQVIQNKERQTQDVLIGSFSYDFTYNEIGKEYFKDPFFFRGKIEVAGNIPALFGGKTNAASIDPSKNKTLLNVPYAQFVKLDVDLRKYFGFFNNKHTLALRQVWGIGIPYGNSDAMPYVRSYFNGGTNDIRAWVAFGGLGPGGTEIDSRVRRFLMGNVKWTTSAEYRVTLSEMVNIAGFTDIGNIWNLKETGIHDGFSFKRFYKEFGIGSGLGIRINVAYITARIDFAYKIYDPNKSLGQRWVISKIQPLKPTLNFAFGVPF